MFKEFAPALCVAALVAGSTVLYAADESTPPLATDTVQLLDGDSSAVVWPKPKRLKLHRVAERHKKGGPEWTEDRVTGIDQDQDDQTPATKTN